MEAYFDGMARCLEFTDRGEAVWYCCNLEFRMGFIMMDVVRNLRILNRQPKNVLVQAALALSCKRCVYGNSIGQAL